MRDLFGFLYVSVLGRVPMVGCNEPGSLQDGDSTSCLRPLDEYCGGSTCPSYEGAIAAAMKRAEQNVPCDTRGPFPATFDAGRCGGDSDYQPAFLASNSLSIRCSAQIGVLKDRQSKVARAW
jgi:hypothetical protein